MYSAYGYPPGSDARDALGFQQQGAASSFANMPVSKLASEYNMSHAKRGLAIIFNNETFQPPELKERTGTGVDSDNLKAQLLKLAFDVKVYKDLRASEIDFITDQTAERNHSECDCLLIVILTHGISGYIYAKDKEYKLESIWTKFTAEKCPTLAGKPKLFIIQACQGDGLDSGTTLVQTDGGPSHTYNYKIPNYSDFLMAYSTITGFYSWRNTTKGSWFIQSLCMELELNGATEDILTIFTSVIRRVAIDFESNTPGNPEMHRQKQIPCVVTMLTRKLFFKRKN